MEEGRTSNVGDRGDGGDPHGTGAAGASAFVSAEWQGKHPVRQPRHLVVHLHNNLDYILLLMPPLWCGHSDWELLYLG